MNALLFVLLLWVAILTLFVAALTARLFAAERRAEEFRNYAEDQFLITARMHSRDGADREKSDPADWWKRPRRPEND